MYRGIAHSGLPRIPTSRHAPIHRNACYSCRQLSTTAALWVRQIKPWEYRGKKSAREEAQVKRKEFEGMIRERRQPGARRTGGSSDPAWGSVPPPPVSRTGSVEFRTKPPTQGTALTGSGTSFIWGKDRESKSESQKQSREARGAPEDVPKKETMAPASAVLGRSKSGPRVGMKSVTREVDDKDGAIDSVRIRWEAPSDRHLKPWPKETKQAAWTPPKIRTHMTETIAPWVDPVQAKEEAAKANRLPRMHAYAARQWADEDYDVRLEKWPTQPYSKLDGELEPWSGEQSELVEAEQESKERRQYLSEYDARPQFKTYGRFDSTSGNDRDMTEMTILKRPARALPFSTATSEFLYGYNICRLALKEKKRKIYKLYVYTGLMRQSGTIAKENILRKLAEGLDIKVESTMDVTLLDAMSKGRPHNGFAIEAEPLAVPQVEYLIQPSADGTFNAPVPHSTQYVQIKTKQQGRKPFVLVLDEVLDGGNFGAILRSAYFLGVDAVFIVSKNSTPATAVTSRASAGALECIDYYDVKNLRVFIERSQAQGWKFYGAMPAPSQTELKASGSANKTKWFDMEGLGDPTSQGPVALVLGNEADGLRPTVQKIMDAFVTIRKGEGVDVVVDSLNVGVAASILTHAFLYPAVKGSKSVPARDRRTEARFAKLENGAKAAENMLFQVDDGKYEAPRYEGVKPAAAPSEVQDGDGAWNLSDNMIPFNDDGLDDDPLKGWNPEDEPVQKIEENESVDEKKKRVLSEFKIESEDELKRLQESENEQKNENEEFSDDEDSFEIDEAILREAQEEVASRRIARYEEEDWSDEEDVENSDEEFDGEVADVDVSKKVAATSYSEAKEPEKEVIFNPPEPTETPLTDERIENELSPQSSEEKGQGVRDQVVFKSFIQPQPKNENIPDPPTDEEVKAEIQASVDEFHNEFDWEDIHEVIEEGVEKQEDLETQKQQNEEYKAKGFEWDAIKPAETDFSAGFVGPAPIVATLTSKDEELNNNPKPEATKPKNKNKNNNLPPLPKRLQEIADKKGFIINGVPTKKQKKALKKEGKKLQQQLRKKVREDASKVRQELQKRHDPTALQAVTSKIQTRSVEMEGQKKKEGNWKQERQEKGVEDGKPKTKGKKKKDDTNYVKLGEWTMSDALK